MSELTEVFEFETKQQRARVLRNAKSVLEDVALFVEKLERGKEAPPSCPINRDAFVRLLMDHERLEALWDALKLARGG